MASPDVDSILNDILLEKTITICAESIYKQNNTVEDLSKSVFSYKRVLSHFQ